MSLNWARSKLTLVLLEVADPELYLRDDYQIWTLPTETIKQVTAIPGLVDKVSRRPSLSSKLEQRFSGMTDREKALLKALTSSEAEALTDFQSLPLNRRAMVIDTAINFLQYKNSIRNKHTQRRDDEIHALLLQRSKLPMSNSQVLEPNLISPENGHDPARIEIAGGSYPEDAATPQGGNHSFLEVSFQSGFHDLLSREVGHAPDSQINFLSLKARYESASDQWRLQRFTLVDIISLFPRTALETRPSWKIKAGWQRNRDIGCDGCTPFVINSGVGLTRQSTLHKREVYFAFIEANLEFDNAFESDYRDGFGATVGLLFDVSERWRLSLVANRTRYSAGHQGHTSSVELRQRFALSRNMEIILNVKDTGKYREGKLGIAYYF